MTKYFTPNDLIRYIYQEMDDVEMGELVQALHGDEQLMQDYLDILDTMEQLDHLILEPSESIIKTIKKMVASSGMERV